MQVFLSYAHTPADTALMSYLSARLRDAGIATWTDVTSLQAGRLVQEDIEDAIAKSDHGIFLVSQSWLHRDWTAFELDLFARRDPRVSVRIPILRGSAAEIVLPPQLTRFKPIEWPEQGTDVDARFWEVYCAVTGTDLGDPGKWADRSRAIGHGSIPFPDADDPKPSTQRPSLRCDRAPQWGELTDLNADASHHVMILPGAAGQDHDHFMARIERWLTLAPPRSICDIEWDPRPRSRDEFIAALARALQVAPASVPAEIAERLTHSNLVLLHPCVRSQFVDQSLIEYYTQWLPDVVTRPDPRWRVKSVQPIEWPASGWLADLIDRWRPGRSDEDDDRPKARELIERLLKATTTDVVFLELPELHDIAPDDLKKFCALMLLTEVQQSWFLERIRRRKPRTSRDVFQAVDEFLPEAKSR
jgi:TIR domain-containing protein/iSTAND domain-containing protein